MKQNMHVQLLMCTKKPQSDLLRVLKYPFAYPAACLEADILGVLLT